jgi:hypothetical protein
VGRLARVLSDAHHGPPTVGTLHQGRRRSRAPHITLKPPCRTTVRLTTVLLRRCLPIVGCLATTTGNLLTSAFPRCSAERGDDDGQEVLTGESLENPRNRVRPGRFQVKSTIAPRRREPAETRGATRIAWARTLLGTLVGGSAVPDGSTRPSQQTTTANRSQQGQQALASPMSVDVPDRSRLPGCCDTGGSPSVPPGHPALPRSRSARAV